MEIGTADDPEVVEAAEFQLGLMRGGDGFVGTYEPWGDDGARCQGSVHDRVFSSAGLWRDQTLTYAFNDKGEIVRWGSMDVYEYEEADRYARELAAWVTSHYPPLAEEFITERFRLTERQHRARVAAWG